MPAIESVIAVVEKASALRDFIQGGGLVEILLQFGDIEFQAAHDALKKAKHSKNVEAEIRAGHF